MANPTMTSLTITLLVLIFTTLQIQGATEAGGASDYMPVGPTRHLPATLLDATPAAQQKCLDCRCCSKTNPGSCVTTTCCYNIDCNVPTGRCTLVPTSCNCNGCKADRPAWID